MYEYRCTILHVVDGDTVDVDIDLGFGVWLRNERVRVIGIDTPESRTSDETEKVFGLYSKKRVKELLPEGSYQILRTVSDKNGEDMKGKFGRILGDFFLMSEGKTLKEYMIENRLAVAYEGQNKDDVSGEHQKNREFLLAEGKVTL